MARSDGYKTRARQMMLDFLVESKDRTVAAAEIEKYMKKQDNPVNISTIYRNLDSMVAAGQLMKYTSQKGDKATYQYIEPEHNCHTHLHIQCVGCGKVVHLECEFMDEIASHIKKEHGITLQCEKSIIYGICESCESKQS